MDCHGHTVDGSEILRENLLGCIKPVVNNDHKLGLIGWQGKIFPAETPPKTKIRLKNSGLEKKTIHTLPKTNIPP